jgi:hypothetical protein
MLLVVRGLPNNVDTTYRCVAENDKVNHYGIVEFTHDGSVKRKLSLPYEARSDVEALMKTYRSVFVDKRPNHIPLTLTSNAKDASNFMEMLRRQKSDSEKAELVELSKASLKTSSNEQVFRGSAVKSRQQCFYKQGDRGSFIQYHSGLKSKSGLCSDVAICTSKTPSATNYLSSLYRAIQQVKPFVKPGATIEDLESKLQSNVPLGVKVVGTSFNHIGYDRVDPVKPTGKIQPHDVLNMNVTFRNTKGVEATIHGGVFAFPDSKANYYRASSSSTDEIPPKDADLGADDDKGDELGGKGDESGGKAELGDDKGSKDDKEDEDEDEDEDEESSEEEDSDAEDEIIKACLKKNQEERDKYSDSDDSSDEDDEDDEGDEDDEDEDDKKDGEPATVAYKRFLQSAQKSTGSKKRVGEKALYPKSDLSKKFDEVE